MSIMDLRAAAAVTALAAAGVFAGCAMGSSAEPVCASAPNDVTLADGLVEEFDVMVVGELHGNRESAERFLELTCDLVNGSSRPTRVGIEIPDFSVEAARHYFTSSDLRHLEEDPFWKGAKDGRASVANLSLLEQLFEVERNGGVQVYGLDGRTTGRENFPKMVVDKLYAASGGQDGLAGRQWVLLLGGGHTTIDASRHSVTDELVARGIRTFVTSLVATGGESWVCRWGECGVSTIPVRDCEQAAPAEFQQIKDGLASTTLCIGTITPSPPAVEELQVGS